ncbi:MAG: DegT/DnrJ/EryC1/StrS family aminotransferase [Planctomycetales bacterium]|nr:DegT/DnrJ/EryC1/StrS family aminotransferase [Planctomycetales bacterium]
MTAGPQASKSAGNPAGKPVPLLDVNRGNAPLRDEMLAAVAAVLDSGRFLHGPEVHQLEQSLATLCQVDHAIGCASGSDALLLALMALDIGPGDEVIVPSFTFFATASAVSRVGAKVVFADIDPATYNIDPLAIEDAITSATKAIIPVHLFGQCADMDAIMKIARRRKLAVIEDACQAIGAAWRGKPAGAWGDVGCFSFYPTKNLGGCGDGGLMTARDPALADRLRLFAAHGMQPRYYHQVIGINSRLDTIQAAMLNVKLQHLPAATQARIDNAARYRSLFAATHLGDRVILPFESPQATHVWNQFPLRVVGSRRDAMRSYLAERGIGSEIYYPVPLHQQACFAHLGYKTGSLPHTERAAEEMLNLPIYPELAVDEQETVVRAISRFYAEQRSAAA